MYMIKADSRNVRVRGWLNDVPLVSPSGTNIGMPLEFAAQWIVDGENTLRLEVIGPSLLPTGHAGFVGDKGERHDTPIIEAEAWVRIIQLPVSFSGGEADGQIISELHWKFTDTPNPPTFPVVREANFMGRGVLGMRWRSSQLPPASPSSTIHLSNWLRELAQAIVQGNTDVVVSAGEPGIRDLCEAMGQDANLQLREFGRAFQQGASGASLMPFHDDEILTMPIANGQLLLCARRDGTPLLRTADGSPRPFSIETRVGMLWEEWKLF